MAGLEPTMACNIACYLEPALLRSGLDHASDPLPFVGEPVIQDPVLWSIMASALGELECDMDPLLRDQFVGDIAQRLSLHAKAPLKRPRFNASQSMDQVRAFLEDNFDRPVQSDELEQVADMDRFRLIRHFRARFGTTPYRYLMMRRLQKGTCDDGAGSTACRNRGRNGLCRSKPFQPPFPPDLRRVTGTLGGIAHQQTH